MEPFIPAGFNLALNWTADLFFPVLLRAVQNINEVVITDEDKAMLRGLKKRQAVIFYQPSNYCRAAYRLSYCKRDGDKVQIHGFQTSF